MITKFIVKEKFLLLLIFITFLNPFFYGYRIALLLFSLPFFSPKLFVEKIDKTLFVLFLFSCTYQIIGAFGTDIDKSLISLLPDLFIPSLMYMSGKYISKNYKYNEIRIFFLLFLAISFSIIPIISILLQILQNGFSQGSRNLSLLWYKNTPIAATGLGGYLALNMGFIWVINEKKTTIFQKRISSCMILLFILSLVCIVRLGDRTELGIAFFSLIFSYTLNIRKSSLLKNLLIILIFVVGYFYIIKLFQQSSILISFYTDRLNSQQAGINTFGGRSSRWGSAFQSILTDPFGWPLSRFGYAHNLWLDVARVSGIIPMLCLIIFTLSSIAILFKSLKYLKRERFLKECILFYYLSIILVFMVEPVMDGLYLQFLLFCLFIGFLSGIERSKNNNLEIARRKDYLTYN